MIHPLFFLHQNLCGSSIGRWNWNRKSNLERGKLILPKTRKRRLVGIFSDEKKVTINGGYISFVHFPPKPNKVYIILLRAFPKIFEKMGNSVRSFDDESDCKPWIRTRSNFLTPQILRVLKCCRCFWRFYG